MSYKTYTTEALVCGSTESNTSDKSFLLFTRDAGMLFASARSVREERSKQRFALQDFSLIRVSLVKGKSGWRIGSVESQGNPFLSAHSRKGRGHVNFIVSQLRRYVHGETEFPTVFEDVYTLLSLSKEQEAHWAVFQTLFLVRLLAELGYIAPKKTWQCLIDAATIEEAFALYTKDMDKEITQAIESASTASHL